MSTQFHGSDLEKIEEVYGIPKEQITGFGSNVNPLGLSAWVKEQLAGRLDCLTSYPDREYKALRQAIAAYNGCDWQDVLCGNGSTELISAAIRTLSPARAAVVGPTYSEYGRELALIGASVSDYLLSPKDAFALHLPALFSFLEETGLTGAAGPDYRDAALLVLCNPNNPTSSALETAQLTELAAYCRDHHIFLLIDETYAEFAPDPGAVTAIPLTARFDNLLVLRGVSKFFAAPGLRLGYGVTQNQGLKEGIARTKDPWTVSSIAAEAGCLLFQDEDYIHTTHAYIAAQRARICRALDALPGLTYYPPAANFVLVRLLDPAWTAGRLFDEAIRQGMMIRDCSGFPGLDDSFFRFCFLKQEDNDRLLDFLRARFGQR